jgi:hypothetical protein
MGHPDENQSGRMRGVRNDTWARTPEMEEFTHPREQTCEGRLEKTQERRRASTEGRKEELVSTHSPGKAEQVPSRSGTPRR